MLFKYKGFDKSGKKAKGTVTASSVAEAGQKLRYHRGEIVKEPMHFCCRVGFSRPNNKKYIKN